MTPNLFIIGAPKCGTSSLFDWLLRHPDICGSRMKEPFFLTDPEHPLSRRPNLTRDGIAAYSDLFAPEDAKASVRMEATTHYLFDPVARAAISSMPDARVIIVLREPAMRVYSSFQYTANNLARLSPSVSFTRYLALIEAGESLHPNWCSHAGSAYVLERDIEYSRYVDHMAPWFAELGRRRIKVLIMEKMVSNPRGAVIELLHWLGLDVGRMPPINQTVRNRTQRVRIPRLQAVARHLNARIRPPEPVRSLAKRAYGALQIRSSEAFTVEEAVALRRLQANYSRDSAALAEIFELDLSCWDKNF